MGEAGRVLPKSICGVRELWLGLGLTWLVGAGTGCCWIWRDERLAGVYCGSSACGSNTNPQHQMQAVAVPSSHLNIPKKAFSLDLSMCCLSRSIVNLPVAALPPANLPVWFEEPWAAWQFCTKRNNPFHRVLRSAQVLIVIFPPHFGRAVELWTLILGFFSYLL